MLRDDFRIEAWRERHTSEGSAEHRMLLTPQCGGSGEAEVNTPRSTWIVFLVELFDRFACCHGPYAVRTVAESERFGGGNSLSRAIIRACSPLLGVEAFNALLAASSRAVGCFRESARGFTLLPPSGMLLQLILLSDSSQNCTQSHPCSSRLQMSSGPKSGGDAAQQEFDKAVSDAVASEVTH